MLAIKFHQIWLRLRQDPRFSESIADIEAYNLCATAAKQGRFTRPTSSSGILSTFKYAFHFDAGLYARYLRRYSEARGITRIEGRIVEVSRADAGHIDSLLLRDGRRITGELFLDCSGFQGLLIDKTLQVGFDSWEEFLPCDRAVAVTCRTVRPLVPYTRATADSAGWRWRIPLQHRTGNGYVYCGKHLSDDEAAGRLLATLDSDPLSEPRVIRFRTGVRRSFWAGNCIAFGLAGGFIEPLESTSIHLIQSGIQKLMALFPDRRFSRINIDEFNRQSALEYEQLRDFILLHYSATERDDSAFWRECRQRTLPASLRDKIDAFKSHGRVLRRPEELFTDDSWVAVMLGQGIKPEGYDPLVDSLPIEGTATLLSQLQPLIARTCAALPSHEEYISAHCRAAHVEPSMLETTR